MISGRSRLTTYENTENLKPGKISSVTAAPPTSGPPLEHERLPAGAREVGGGDEPVVAAADDDRVVALASDVSCFLPRRIEERQLAHDGIRALAPVLDRDLDLARPCRREVRRLRGARARGIS